MHSVLDIDHSLRIQEMIQYVDQRWSFRLLQQVYFTKAHISLMFGYIWSYNNYCMFYFMRFPLPAWQLRQQSPWWRYCSFSTHVLCRRRVRFLYSSLDHWDAGSSAAWHTSPKRNAATNTWIIKVRGRKRGGRTGREREKEKESFALFLFIHSIQTHPLKLSRRTVKRMVHLHRKPCVSNLWLNLNHLIWTSVVGKPLREPSSQSELEAKQPCVCRMQSYTLTACSATGKQT